MPPLIDLETFDAVQTHLKARNPKVTPPRVVSGPTLLTGICFCAKCGGAVVQRADDTEESVRKRLATYLTQTQPLMTWFADHGKLVTVDGVGDPDDIARALVAAIIAGAPQ